MGKSSKQPVSRFVILHHRLTDGEHWDLMLERGDALLTWQLPREPVGPECLPIRARQIGSHRKAYLDYEGPVSGDRGVVRRVDGGRLEWFRDDGDRLVFRLNGRRLAGRFCLALEGEDWWLRFDPGEPLPLREAGPRSAV